MTSDRFVVRASAWGAFLTLVILAMSALLRLGTQASGGEAVSTLPTDVEQWARIAHRVAAMGVGVLAAVVLVQVLREKPAQRARVGAAIAVAALTVALAMIGRYTPGYRFPAVTVGNVVGGMALAATFWWLASPRRRERGTALAWLALAALFVLAGLGSAASHGAVHGRGGVDRLHVAVALVYLALALAAAWRSRARPGLALTVSALALGQFGLGLAMALAAPGRPPLALAWSHALVAFALAPVWVAAAVGTAFPAKTTAWKLANGI